MIGALISLLIVGAVAGFLARALVPGDDSMSVGMTILLGIAGSFVGGLIATLLDAGEVTFRPVGILGSLLGAIVVLLLWRATHRRGVLR
jgi:uncharacterized membrane protein YeaQ/YmgE (transglycosylase-associated protein family)